MPPRPSIPSEEVQLNDTDTERTGPENTQAPVGSSNPILIGQLRMIQVVSASDSFEETSSSSDDSYSEDSEVTRGESRQQSSLQAEQTLSLIDAADEIANPSSNDQLQTGPSMQGSDVKSTWEISSTTNPFYESNERPEMENSQEITSSAPSYPMFESLFDRLRSLSNWPSHKTQTPHEMASAGFFYKGYGDFTQCFFCGGVLKDWEAEDDPLNGQEHQEVNETSHKDTGDPTSAKAEEEKVVISPAVTSIKRMGYSKDKIKAAINIIKSRLPRGKHKISAQEILGVIFELNESSASGTLRDTVSENFLYDTTISESVMENTTYYMHYPTPNEEGKIFSTNEPYIAAEASSSAHPTEETSQNDQIDTCTNASSSPSFDDMTSLKQMNTDLRNQTLCKICVEKTVSIAFLPCGHLVCCEDCATAMRKCPICRELVRSTVKTWAS
uniref:RING-type domain-containing protein n=1 Tax=Magallana gigas TaxID=29159 RepID=A0A8W8JKX1_MAGGI